MSDGPDSRVIVQRATSDFQAWDGLLELLCAAFAYQESWIDPPSSVYALDPESLAKESSQKQLFLG